MNRYDNIEIFNKEKSTKNLFGAYHFMEVRRGHKYYYHSVMMDYNRQPQVMRVKFSPSIRPRCSYSIRCNVQTKSISVPICSDINNSTPIRSESVGYDNFSNTNK